jgi:isopenicillin N synthase-like dioxygenase
MQTAMETGIPVLDLKEFTDQSTEQEFVDKIGKAYENIGFIALKNHGVDEELLNDFYRNIKAFFNLPYDVKNKYNDNNGGQRGYTPFGIEHAKGRPAADLKEFWHFGQWVENDPQLANFYPKNQWVKEIPAFNELGKKIYQSLEQTATLVLQSIALYLKLDKHYFDDKIINGNSILRPIHYPPITSEPKNSIRAGEHEDINLITLLVGASADGLQVLNKKGEWVGVTKVEDCIVINVGDMLQRLTNNKLKSTTHRVINPPKKYWGTSRFSIPFFLHPKPDVSLDCLENCISMDHPKLYESITAIEYLNQRLAEIGLK